MSVTPESAVDSVVIPAAELTNVLATACGRIRVERIDAVVHSDDVDDVVDPFARNRHVRLVQRLAVHISVDRKRVELPEGRGIHVALSQCSFIQVLAVRELSYLEVNTSPGRGLIQHTMPARATAVAFLSRVDSLSRKTAGQTRLLLAIRSPTIHVPVLPIFSLKPMDIMITGMAVNHRSNNESRSVTSGTFTAIVGRMLPTVSTWRIRQPKLSLDAVENGPPSSGTSD